MIFRGFTYRLKPTDAQTEKFEQFAGVCRLIWNLALEQRRNHWRNYQARTGDNLNYVTQARELTKLRAEFDFIRNVSQPCQQFALKSLDEAYRRAWKGTGGFPDFKAKGNRDSFTFSGRDVEIQRINKRWGRVWLPKIGWVKFRITFSHIGKISEATVSRTPLGWQVSVGCKIDASLPEAPGAIGIDRGVVVPIMLSDGQSFILPSGVAETEKLSRKAQRIVSKRKRGSNRHAKAQRHVAKLRARQARIRKDWAHKATTAICRQYGTVIIERLRTKSMTKSASGTIGEPGKNVSQKRGLNRAILNVGWHQIETMLFYKSNRVIKVDPAYTSQTCSACGTIDSKSRENQASFACKHCGHTMNADHNAAINILNRGITPGVEPSLDGVEARTVQVA